MIKYRSQTLSQSGFTIIELLVVMMVISIMAAPFAYQHIQKFEEDRIAITIAEVNGLPINIGNQDSKQKHNRNQTFHNANITPIKELC